MAFKYSVKTLPLLILLGFAPSKVATAASPVAMQTGAYTSQPIGHYEFCQTYRDDCARKSPNAPAPTLTEYGWKVVREVNASVNHSIVPMTDHDIYGRDEVWAFPDGVGDCEDFVLEKRRQLIEKGIPAGDLLITVVRKPDGEGHAVLTLRTSKGDFILDNLDRRVKLWIDTPYRYLKRQAVSDAGRWVTIENGANIVVGALRQ